MIYALHKLTMSSPFEIYDLIGIISSFLDFRDRKPLVLVNKSCATAYKVRHLGNKRVVGIELYMDKDKILDEICKNDSAFISVMAPPSYGKTLLILLIALTKYKYTPGEDVTDSYERFIIVVPKRCMSTFRDEIKRYMPTMFNPDPVQSPTLINHRLCARHWKYAGVQPFGPKTKIILCTPREYRSVLIIHPTEMAKMSLIADEAHSTQACELADLVNCRQIYAFSATDHSYSSRNNIREHQITVSADTVLDNVPQCNIMYNTTDLQGAIVSAVNKYQKIVIFKRDAKACAALTPSWLETPVKIFRFISSLKSIEKFREHKGQAIMFTEYSAAKVGVNFCGDAVILTDSENMSSIQVHQIISRLLRITNKAQNVDVLMLYPKQSCYFAKFKVAMVNIKRTHDFFTLPNVKAEKVVQSKVINFVLKKLTLKLEDVDDVHYLMYMFPLSRKVVKLCDDAGIAAAERKYVRRLHREYRKDKSIKHNSKI